MSTSALVENGASSPSPGAAHRVRRTRRNMRRAAAGVAATTVVYAALLAVTDHEQHSPGVAWALSSAEPLHPYGAAVAERVTAAGQDAAQALTWLHTFAPWPLAALSLLWLARRHQTVYVRLAVALLLSGVAGLGVFAAVRGLPLHEVPLIRGYLALPGVPEGWYLLMALAVAATTVKAWPRVAVLLVALSAVVAATATADRPLLGALLSVVVPVLSWYAAGSLRGREQKQRRRAAGEPEGDVVVFRPRSAVPEPEAAAPVPLRRAG